MCFNNFYQDNLIIVRHFDDPNIEQSRLQFGFKQNKNTSNPFNRIDMGNNHNQYFGKEKRKILVLGLQNSGKTTLVNFLVTRQMNTKVQATKDLNIKDLKINKLTVTFFDVAGGQRQRVFWKHNYEGTQGIIYMIDATSTQQQIDKSLNELDKVLNAQELLFVPVAIGLSKSQMVNNYKKESLSQLMDKKTSRYTQKIGVFRTSFEDISSMQSMVTWLVQKTKPL